VAGARCAIRRDEQKRITFYEASIPLDEMPTLRPAMRARGDVPVRFSWILHTDEGPALEWSRATSVFPWWSNTGSFLPPQQLYLAAQTPVGFTLNGTVDAGPGDDARPEEVRPIPVRPRPLPTPPPSTEPPTLPEISPLPPRVLPPVESPDGNPLPPAPPPGGALPDLPPGPDG
jgi:hypothetical protein